MASTTASKKEIVDFLWEWAQKNGQWSEQLIEKIVTKEDGLTEPERETIFNYFLQSIKLHSGLAVSPITKPKYVPTDKKIVLTSLSDIKGVNKLAKNQMINFSPNVTVIYGENGTGKTGYGRILKALGFSYDPYNSILSNVFGSEVPKSAVINFESNGVAVPAFNWNGTNKDNELENISVFNSNCVQFSLADRQLIVSPIGFHLFNLVSTELNELAKLLQKKIDSHPTILDWAETSLNEGTQQQIFIKGLSNKSTEQKLNELSTFTEQQQKELKDKEKELSNLNRTLIETEIQKLVSEVNELGEIIEKIKNAETNLSQTNWKGLIDYNVKIKELEGKTQTGIKDIAEINGIQFYETEQFQFFIKAAEDYIKVINKPEYPEENDTCIYCLQPLQPLAKDLLTSYRTLLNDTTQETLQSLKKEKMNLINLVSNIDTKLLFHQSTFGVDDNKKAIQPKEILDYNKDLGELKKTFVTDKIADDSIFSFDYTGVLSFLSNKQTALDSSLTQKRNLLLNIDTKEKELKAIIFELKDRKFLSTKLKEIKTAMSNHKIVAALSSKSNSFNTSSISRKTTEAREELVKQNFDDIFQNELKALRKSNIKIDLSFITDRGKSKVYQKIGRHSLTDILSEGEQKAIALAEFLTELQLDNIKAPVIFDDPVNSLDHRIIDEVSKRLIELSKHRQVIVFTHSILLLNSLIQQSELEPNKKSLKFNFLSVMNNFGETGIIDEVEEINSYNYYQKKLNLVLNTKPNGQSETKLAKEGYGHLRSCIEVTVEDLILKNTIKRYRKGVAFPSLLRIDGIKIDANKSKLNDIYEKCCVSIDGHSSPTEIEVTPTIDELKSDLEEFKNIRQNFV